MTHAPPLPDAARAPWPAHPAPHEAAPETAAPETAAPGTVKDEPQPGSGARTLVRIGVGAAIGSAAVAAALLYVNHGRKK